ncbi:hypothetical protein [Spirosoma fluminis]
MIQRNSSEIAQLGQVRQSQIMALGIGLAGINATSLPAVLKHGQQLSLLRKTDEPTLLKALIVLIGLTNDALNVNRMSPVQMLDAARHILKTYWYFKPEEIAYVFDQGRSGKYGKSYNRLDLEVLTNWLHAYDTDERLSICERGRSENVDNEEQKLSTQAVVDSYQRFAEGEPLLQEKIEAERRNADYQIRRQTHNYHVFRESYFQKRDANQSTTPDHDNVPTAESSG